MKITFETIKFKNILSYGNRLTEFNFKNGIDLVIGSNGKGKSTLVDALTYALFGKPFRKMKIGDLVNNTNGKALYVVLEFFVDDRKFKIERGIRPDKFDIYKKGKDGWELIKKHSTNRDYQKMLEEDILSFGENVFRQLIALGANLSSSKSFMELSRAEKEEVLQVITDTAIFNEIKEKAKERRLAKKTLETEYSYKLDVLKSSIDSTNVNIRIIEEQNRNFAEKREKILSELTSELKTEEEKIEKYPKVFKVLDELEDEILKLEEKYRKLSEEYNGYKDKEREIKVQAIRLKENEQNKIICPSCGFEIKESLPYSKESLKERLLEIKSPMNKLSQQIENLEKEIQERKEKVRNRNRLEQNMRQTKENIRNLKKKIENTENWEITEVDYSELERLEKDYTETKEKLLKVKNEISDFQAIEDLVSDKKLKGVIINQQLPFLNKHINSFLEMFDSQYNFVIDHSFQEKIISRERDSDFNALSNGQKQRISLSILFAFLKLIEERNGISTNVLILDEYLDSSLDVEGIEEVMNILSQIFGETKDVILISHNADIKEKLELLNRIVEIDQKDGFSIMKVEEL